MSEVQRDYLTARDVGDERAPAVDAGLPAHLAGPLDDWSDADYDAILLRAAQTGTPLGGRSVGRLAARLAAVTAERDRMAAVVSAAREWTRVMRDGADRRLNLTIAEHDAWLERLDDAERALIAAVTAIDAARPTPEGED